MTRSHSGIVVFSGGSAANSLVDVFGRLARGRECPLTYVIPISDNGGSSSELMRVFAGPGIGDVRSRLVRLIPSHPATPERTALKAFFSHRLPSSRDAAQAEWLSVIASMSPLWTCISLPKRELIRSFLLHLHLEILRRTRPPLNTFDFSSAAVGNLFLTGARLFCGSFEAAIELLKSITGVQEGVEVVPAVESGFSHHIAAGLEEGRGVIVGQNAISHPGEATALENGTTLLSEDAGAAQDMLEFTREPVRHDDPSSKPFTPHLDPEDALPPFSHPTLRSPALHFSKTATAQPPLPARIARIWYINPYGQPIHPPANPRALAALARSEAVIYSIGSLFTSIVPCLVLQGVGARIRDPRVRWKVLILNGEVDRETGLGLPSSQGGEMVAADYVRAITRACKESQTSAQPENVTVSSDECRAYVTHVIFLDPGSGPMVPKVDLHELRQMGVEGVKVYGRSAEGGGMRYDPTALGQALEAILGRSGAAAGGDSDRGGGKGRRMTMGE
ncbi:MAG: hypothetical protein M1817_005724 [Caeruleum heppii]|nr:MAG: hypothetical protein M1817_005724 [Caeruleum heppii]